MTIANEWNLTEFVKKLNQEVPLSKGEDARRANEWTPRLVRHYCATKSVSQPVKRGKFAYYNDQHLEQIRVLVSLQDVGATYKTAALLQGSTLYTSSLDNYSNENMSTSLDNEIKGFTTSNLRGFSGQISDPQLISNMTVTSYSSEDNKEKALSLLNSYQVQRPVNEVKSLAALSVQATTIKKSWRIFTPVDGLNIQLREDLWSKENELLALIENWKKTL